MVHRPMDGQLRLAGAFRGAIITYGIAAYALFVRWPAPDPAAAGLLASTPQMVLAGLALQASIFIVRRFTDGSPSDERPDEPFSPRAAYLFELVADGVTVLLFALATYGRIAGFAAGF
jgi:hypothetical protein